MPNPDVRAEPILVILPKALIISDFRWWPRACTREAPQNCLVGLGLMKSGRSLTKNGVMCLDEIIRDVREY